MQIIIPYLKLSPSKAFCFITLRCVEWKENDDPWKEQKKYIGQGTLPDYVPRAWRGNDYEIIRKPMVILEWDLIKFYIRFRLHIQFKN